MHRKPKIVRSIDEFMFLKAQIIFFGFAKVERPLVSLIQ